MKANEMIERLNKELETINKRNSRSAWNRGVGGYAKELLEEFEENTGYYDEPHTAVEFEKILLNGAANWNEYSWGGSALIYNGDIAERLCNPSELKKTRNGERRPNSREEWLDTQARALKQAASRLKSAFRVVTA